MGTNQNFLRSLKKAHNSQISSLTFHLAAKIDVSCGSRFAVDAKHDTCRRLKQTPGS